MFSLLPDPGEGLLDVVAGRVAVGIGYGFVVGWGEAVMEGPSSLVVSGGILLGVVASGGAGGVSTVTSGTVLLGAVVGGRSVTEGTSVSFSWLGQPGRV